MFLGISCSLLLLAVCLLRLAAHRALGARLSVGAGGVGGRGGGAPKTAEEVKLGLLLLGEKMCWLTALPPPLTGGLDWQP